MKKTQDTKLLLLNYLKEILAADKFAEIYFGYAEPLPPVSSSLNYLSRITIPIEGVEFMVAAYDGKIGTRELTPERILFTGRNGWAYSTPQSPYTRGISIVFMETYVRLVYGELRYGEKIYNPWYHTAEGPGEISRNILRCLNKIMFEADTDRQARAISLIKALLYQVIEKVEHESSTAMTKAEKTLKSIIEYTQQYYHSPINRASVSHELRLNPSSLSRIFKENMGQNFNNYLNQLRMEKAELILKNYDLPVERIADQCGFTSSGYFIKAFKKYFGLTPGAFHNANRE
jgi:AraC-like DNA-binding protein